MIRPLFLSLAVLVGTAVGGCGSSEVCDAEDTSEACYCARNPQNCATEPDDAVPDASVPDISESDVD